jgi:hypothetical protein
MQRVPFEQKEHTFKKLLEIRQRTHKVCTRCKRDLPLSEFYRKSRYADGHDCICKDCDKKQQKEKYDSVKAKQYNDSRKEISAHNTAEYRNRLKKELIERLGGKCSKCGLPYGEQWPICCFDFHHQEGSIKENTIAHIMGIKKKRDLVINEVLSHCILLCSNCHRIKHFKYLAVI